MREAMARMTELGTLRGDVLQLWSRGVWGVRRLPGRGVNTAAVGQSNVRCKPDSHCTDIV